MSLQTKNIDRGFITSLPDWKFAMLLRLSLEEYHDLSHRGLKELTDLFGKVNEYYVHVSPNNKQATLRKLDLDQYGYVRFKPEEVHSIMNL